MRRTRSTAAGYTIIEVMLFLLITGVLLVGVLGLFNGRIARTQFTQAVQELDNKIKGTINEVSAGTYPSTTPFTCTASATGISISTGGGQQGTRGDCVFLGKVMQFGVSGQGGCSATALKNCQQFAVYTTVGRRLTATGQEVQGLTSPNGALPELVDGIAPSADVNITQTTALGAGMSVSKVVQLNSDGTTTPVGAIGVLQTSGSYTSGASGSRLNPGAQTVQSWPIVSGAFPRTPAQVHNAVSNHNAGGTFNPANANPSGGFLVCLASGTTNQKASIAIGADAGRVTTNVTIGDSRC